MSCISSCCVSMILKYSHTSADSPVQPLVHHCRSVDDMMSDAVIRLLVGSPNPKRVIPGGHTTAASENNMRSMNTAITTKKPHIVYRKSKILGCCEYK